MELSKKKVLGAAQEILHGDGYVLLKDYFDPGPSMAEISKVRGQIKDPLFASGGYRLGCGLTSLQALMVDPGLMAVGEAVLGSRPAYGSLDTNIVPPGSEGMDPHLDYPYFAMDSLPPRSSPAFCVQMIWYLEDVRSMRHAPTLVVPGTQRRPRVPSRERFRKKAVRLAPRAGTVLIGHGAIWHGVGPNLESYERPVALASYLPFWVHPMLMPARVYSTVEGFDVMCRSDFSQRMGEGYGRLTSVR